MIRQTWFETARKNLKGEERLRFYEACLEYEFEDIEPASDLPFAARLLFDMVRADIDQDKERATRKAEISRQNGSKGGRPKVTTLSNDEENPAGYVGLEKTCIYTTIHNSTQQDTVSVDDSSEDTHRFFEVLLNFFERGASIPIEEANTFWGYYESLGWKTKDGRDVVNKLALAKAWRLREVSTPAIKRRKAWADLLHEVKPTEAAFVSEFVDITKDTAEKKVYLTMATREPCMVFENKYASKATIWFEKWAPGYALEYRVLQQTL